MSTEPITLRDIINCPEVLDYLAAIFIEIKAAVQCNARLRELGVVPELRVSESRTLTLAPAESTNADTSDFEIVRQLLASCINEKLNSKPSDDTEDDNQ
jgi:hypothetical protein